MPAIITEETNETDKTMDGDFDLAGKQKLTTSLRDEQKMFDLFKERQT